MGGAPKPFLELGGRPVLLWALETLLAPEYTAALVVVLPPGRAERSPDWLTARDPRIRVVSGGATRTESVARGLDALPEDVDVICVHDGARPFVDSETLARLVETATTGVGAVVGYPAVDTIKDVSDDGVVQGTPDRARLWQVQTPQVFPAALLRAAYATEQDHPRRGSGAVAWDDAQLVERAGGTVRVIRGSPDNLKVTYPRDLMLAEAILAGRRPPTSVPGA